MTYRACTNCVRWRIRVFMLVGFFLMLCMFIQPDGIVRLAAKMPSALSIGLGILGLGTVMGILRYRQEKRSDPETLAQ